MAIHQNRLLTWLGITAGAITLAASIAAAVAYVSFSRLSEHQAKGGAAMRAHQESCISESGQARRECSMEVLKETPHTSAAFIAAKALASSKGLMRESDYDELDALLADAYDREAAQLFVYRIANWCLSIAGDSCPEPLALRERGRVLNKMSLEVRSVQPRGEAHEPGSMDEAEQAVDPEEAATPG